jgi:hypothetical protein
VRKCCGLCGGNAAGNDPGPRRRPHDRPVFHLPRRNRDDPRPIGRYPSACPTALIAAPEDSAGRRRRGPGLWRLPARLAAFRLAGCPQHPLLRLRTWRYAAGLCPYQVHAVRIDEGARSRDRGRCRDDQCRDLRILPPLRQILHQLMDTELEPLADDVASLGLGLFVHETGFARGGVNPFLLGY